jgi:hypothetical protein
MRAEFNLRNSDPSPQRPRDIAPALQFRAPVEQNAPALAERAETIRASGLCRRGGG